MVKLIKGGVGMDHRGQIRFNNEFDMEGVKRFYLIKNKDLNTVRGWRGHRIENRWFYVISGAFSLKYIEIDNWSNADTGLPIKEVLIDAKELNVVHVPPGYATAFQALQDNSELLVFADSAIQDACLDDHTWDQHYFTYGR